MAPNDRIELRRLVVTGICGALPEERERAQPLEVDLDVVADLSAAGASDNLDDTLDYGAITAAVENVILNGTPQLLEHLAQNIADAVLADPRALS
ncbi:MAG: FolB domain-containing protein, partial [Actinobacteria bacterium]|nr:FolB domain-containing protein [Actinomycetota bacterium]